MKTVGSVIKASASGRRRAIAYGAGLLGFGVVSFSHYFTREANREQEKLDRVHQQLKDAKVEHLRDGRVASYPW